MKQPRLTISGNYSGFQTVKEFWDCECETNFIKNKKQQPTCHVCKTRHDESADSRLHEVLAELKKGM